MKNHENSQSENITTIEESNILKNVLNQQNIFPILKHYSSFTNTHIIKNSKINTSFNNSKLYSNKSSNNLNTKYHNSDLFPFPQKKKYHEKNNYSFKLMKGKIYITENLKKKMLNNSLEQNKEENKNVNKNINDDISFFDKINKVKYIPIDNKKNKIKLGNKFSIQDYLSKTKELNLMKYNLDIKKEKLNSYIEDRQSKISNVENHIKYLNYINTQFTNQFMVKFNEYMKKLDRQYKKETFENNQLLRIIEKLKNELQVIHLKLNKLQMNKKAIGKWFYLQIQVKEKLTSLPNYYELILENEKNEILKTIDQNEINRIKNYNKTILYENISDFINEFKRIEDNIIMYIKKYEKIKDEIYELKQYKNELQQSILKFESHDITLVKEKEEKLKQVKNLFIKTIYKGIGIGNIIKKQSNYTSRKHSYEINEDYILYNNSINSISKINLFHSLFQDCLDNKFPKKEKYSEKYIKIFEIFKTSFAYKNKISKYINHLFSLYKVDNTNESRMICMLEFIEQFINYLIFQYRYYKSNPILFLEYKNARSIVDSDNKQRKYLNQIKKMKEKRKEINKKIEDRMNKKYFLPYRKFNINYIDKINKDKEKVLLYKKEKSASVEIKDFLYDT